MLSREDILKHIPHQGKSCLLDTCETWTDDTLTAHTSAHLRDDNPLRYQGRLGIIVGAEMAMQAAALHGALTGDQTAKARGYLASCGIWCLRVTVSTGLNTVFSGLLSSGNSMTLLVWSMVFLSEASMGLHC
nr:hypothetical protein [Acetobacter persici]